MIVVIIHCLFCAIFSIKLIRFICNRRGCWYIRWSVSSLGNQWVHWSEEWLSTTQRVMRYVMRMDMKRTRRYSTNNLSLPVVPLQIRLTSCVPKPPWPWPTPPPSLGSLRLFSSFVGRAGVGLIDVSTKVALEKVGIEVGASRVSSFFVWYNSCSFWWKVLFTSHYLLQNKESNMRS